MEVATNKAVLDGRFTLMKRLGDGATSKVKLGVDKETGQEYAIKILKKGSSYHENKKLLDTLVKEIKSMQGLKHDNIIQLIGYGDNGVVEKPNGDKSPNTVYLVLENAQGGLLFDYVSMTGSMPENIARAYFLQTIKALHYIHAQGITHRDMKLENILLDMQYNLKIADFGFAAPAEGMHQTYLGTPRYMAPEILEGRPYEGKTVDLFAAANILFCLYAGHAPYRQAMKDDPWYQNFVAKNYAKFWAAHEGSHDPGFFSENFKDLLNHMLAYDPKDRITSEEVLAHPWCKESSASMDDIMTEFTRRHEVVNAEIKKKEQESESDKNKKRKGYGGKKVYRAVGGEEKERELKAVTTHDYVPNQEFYSTYDAETILQHLEEFAKEDAERFVVADESYKIDFVLNREDEHLEGVTETVGMQVKIMKADDDKLCVRYKRTTGDMTVYAGLVKDMREHFEEYINAVRE